MFTVFCVFFFYYILFSSQLLDNYMFEINYSVRFFYLITVANFYRAFFFRLFANRKDDENGEDAIRIFLLFKFKDEKVTTLRKITSLQRSTTIVYLTLTRPIRICRD